MIETVLKGQMGEMLGTLTRDGGLAADQAESLLPPALGGIGDALSSGKIDVASLVSGGDLSSLLGRLDISSIASQAGLGEDQARGGVAALVPVVLSLLTEKTGGAEGLAAMLGGGGDAGGGAAGLLGGVVGKLFGR